MTHLHNVLEVALSVHSTPIRLIGLLELSNLIVHFFEWALLNSASELQV